MFFHRDAMAGHNICNIVRNYLLHQERPLYLHPVDEQGNSLWIPSLSDSIVPKTTVVSRKKGKNVLGDNVPNIADSSIPKTMDLDETRSRKRKKECSGGSLILQNKKSKNV